MSNVTDMHPVISTPKAIRDPRVDGEYLCNIPMAISIAKEGGTPKAKRLYRLYVKEFHALNGQPISHQTREEMAFRAAATTLGWKFKPLR